jgi:anti-sigma B factor antagonist
MDIDRRLHPDAIELVIEGRLDSYWADHLDVALAEIVREGHDRLRLDLSRTMFLSSAGVAVLMKYYKQLLRINGSLAIVDASEAVRLVLDMTRLTPILVRSSRQTPAAAAETEGRRLDYGGARFEVFDLERGASLTCRTLGDATALGRIVGDGAPIVCHPSLLAVGIGAIGGGQADCQGRFGDLLAAGGAIVYQPADGTNVPDYLISGDDTAESAVKAPAPEARVLYGLACDGPFAAFSRFEATTEVGTIGLSDLAGGCLEIADWSAPCFVGLRPHRPGPARARPRPADFSTTRKFASGCCSPPSAPTPSASCCSSASSAQSTRWANTPNAARSAAHPAWWVISTPRRSLSVRFAEVVSTSATR